jgi:hypothetical protein
LHSTHERRRTRSMCRAHKLLFAVVTAFALTFALGAAAASAATPVVTIRPAAEVGFTTALAEGEVNPENHETSYHFEYTTQAQYEAEGNSFANAAQTGFGSLAEGAGATPVQATLENLAASTTYHLRLVAENEDSAGVPSEAVAATFTTQTATAPTLTVEPVTSFAYTTAHIEGAVNPEGGSVNPIGPTVVPIAWELQINREGNGWVLAEAGTIEGAEAESSSPITVAKDLEGLQNGAEYQFRLIARYAGEEVLSAAESFETLEVIKPTVTIEAPTSVTGTAAHFSGQINPNGTDPAFAVTYHFQCTPACPSAEAPASLPAGESPQAVSVTATHLQPDTPYEVVLSAENLGGTESASEGFETLVLPLATLISATDITQTTATLHATIDAKGLTGTYSWSISSSTSPYQESIPSAPIPAGSGPVAVSVPLTDLPSSGAFTATLIVNTAAATVNSEPLKFQTVAFPPRPIFGPPVSQPFACADPGQSVADGCVSPSKSVKHHKHKKHKKHRKHKKA